MHADTGLKEQAFQVIADLMRAEVCDLSDFTQISLTDALSKGEEFGIRGFADFFQYVGERCGVEIPAEDLHDRTVGLGHKGAYVTLGDVIDFLESCEALELAEA